MFLELEISKIYLLVMNSGIYSIENSINGKSYIGSSINIKRRWYRHLSMLRKNVHDNHYLQNAYNKYGEQSFKFKVLELVLPCKIKQKEQSYLNKVKFTPDLYYNINYDADRINFTQEIRMKMSNKAKLLIGERNPFYGKTHSKETKLKIRLKLLNQKLSNLTKKRISDSIKAAWINRINREPKKTDKTIYNFKNNITEEIFIGRRVDFYKKYNLPQEKVCRMVKSMRYGITKRCKGWEIINEKCKSNIYSL
jgi:group I intron endonuclease